MTLLSDNTIVSTDNNGLASSPAGRHSQVSADLPDSFFFSTPIRQLTMTTAAPNRHHRMS